MFSIAWVLKTRSGPAGRNARAALRLRPLWCDRRIRRMTGRTASCTEREPCGLVPRDLGQHVVLETQALYVEFADFLLNGGLSA